MLIGRVKCRSVLIMVTSGVLCFYLLLWLWLRLIGVWGSVLAAARERLLIDGPGLGKQLLTLWVQRLLFNAFLGLRGLAAILGAAFGCQRECLKGALISGKCVYR